jgi:hypothetical protein
MKTALACCFALLALAPAQAQVFRPEAMNGAVLGGIAGAVIGNNSGDLHHNAWKGAAIGAGAGLLLGEAVGNANANARATQVGAPYATSGGYVYRNEPAVRVGFGVGYRGGYGYYGPRHSGYYYGPRYGYGYYGYGRDYYTPTYSYYDGYGYGYPNYSDYGYYSGGSAAGSGLLLGALAGGTIGNNSGDFRHNGLRGAAWGAGAGLLLGSIIDANRRPVVASAPVVVQQAPAVQGQVQAAPAQAQPVTIINNYYNSSTPMSSANSLFGR